MLAALKRWRKFNDLSVLPTPADDSPLIPVHRGKGPLSNTTHIRSIMQTCFDHAIDRLTKSKQTEEAEALMDATVHWLRHTGIPSDFIRTEYIDYKPDFEKRFSSYLNNIIEQAEYYEKVSDQLDRDPILSIDYLKRSFLITGDKRLKAKASNLRDGAGIEQRAANSVEHLLSTF